MSVEPFGDIQVMLMELCVTGVTMQLSQVSREEMMVFSTKAQTLACGKNSGKVEDRSCSDGTEQCHLQCHLQCLVEKTGP